MNDYGGTSPMDKLSEIEERLHIAVNSTGLGTWDCDLTTGRVTWSDRCREILGVSADAELDYERFLKCVHPDDRTRVHRRTQRVLASGARGDFDLEYRVLRPDGSICWLVARGRVLFRGAGLERRAVRFIGTMLDITDRKQTEHELRAINETLEERIAERTAIAERQARQLRHLAVELTQTEQRERRRLARVLHDHLQQLLVAAKMGVGMLRGRAGDLESREALQEIDGLLLESIEASRSLTVELSPPILYDGGLAAGLEWLARWMGEKYGLKVRIEAGPDAEPETEEVSVLLFAAVRELLFNVVKHAQVDAAEVRIRRLPRDRACITVTDVGVGFDPSRLEAEEEAVDGFGLFSVRERLDLIGGGLKMDSAPGRGTRVTLFAPLQAEAASKRRRSGAEPPAQRSGSRPGSAVERGPRSGKIRVMLVDDHKIVRQGLAGLLRSHADIEIAGEASDGEMAIELVRAIQPDVIVMDINMPRMNGIEATRRITAERPEVRVIGLSLHEIEDMAAAMREAGAAAYLTKGGPSEDLVAAIRDSRAPAAGRDEPRVAAGAAAIS